MSFFSTYSSLVSLALQVLFSLLRVSIIFAIGILHGSTRSPVLVETLGIHLYPMHKSNVNAQAYNGI